MIPSVEPKVAPAQLGESALRDLVEAAFDALVIARRGVVVFANRSFCEMSGWTFDEVVGRSVLEFVAPSSRAMVLERMLQSVECRYEALGLCRDGSTIAVEVCARECVYEGEPARITAIKYIEDRRRAEDLLRRSEARLREVIEGLPDMIAVHRGGVITFANPALVRYLGYTETERLVGHPLTDFVHPDDRDVVRERAGGTLRGSMPFVTFRTLREDGTSGVVEVASAPIDFDGEPAVLTIGRDIAERKRMEVRLMQAELLSSVGMLAAGITHEINTPLTYVLLNLDILARRVSNLVETVGAADGSDLAEAPGSPQSARTLAAEISQLVAETRDGASRVKQIGHEFQVFARGGDARPRPLDVRGVLDGVVKLAFNELRHRARLVRSYEEVPAVVAAEARLGQLFLNLLLNAMQALPEGSRPGEHEIRVSTRTGPDGAAVVEIADTGVGIPRDLVGRVFEPFFSTKAAGLGSGLGLSICQSIVSSLGGRIEVESGNARGATFRVTLPAAPSPDTASDERPPSSAPRPRAARLRLLLVDDEERLVTVLASELSRDYVVEKATSGAEAIRRLTDAPFDVVVCDLMMPGLSGADVYEAARRICPELTDRFVFMTGGAFTTGMRLFLERVPNPRLEKPFELQELRNVLCQLLGPA